MEDNEAHPMRPMRENVGHLYTVQFRHPDSGTPFYASVWAESPEQAVEEVKKDKPWGVDVRIAERG